MFFALVIFYFIEVISGWMNYSHRLLPWQFFEWSVLVGSHRRLVNLPLFSRQKFSAVLRGGSKHTTAPLQRARCLSLAVMTYSFSWFRGEKEKPKYPAGVARRPTSISLFILFVSAKCQLCSLTASPMCFLHSDLPTTARLMRGWTTKSDPRPSWVTCTSVQPTRGR